MEIIGIAPTELSKEKIDFFANLTSEIYIRYIAYINICYISEIYFLKSCHISEWYNQQIA